MIVFSYQTYHVVATMMVSHTKKSPDLHTRIYSSSLFYHDLIFQPMVTYMMLI